MITHELQENGLLAPNVRNLMVINDFMTDSGKDCRVKELSAEAHITEI